ncbi:accessory gland protein Acp53Ea [Drosophila yakuba]|nr:accessory gland protein Acp53Ea [Drosophila yakuba]
MKLRGSESLFFSRLVESTQIMVSMKQMKVTLVFGLLALVFVGQTEAQSPIWENWLSCSKIGAKAVASLLRETIPTVRTLLNCVDFDPPANIGNGYLAKLKLYYELLRRGAFEKSQCLLSPLKHSVRLLKPYVKSLETNNCLGQ